MHQICSAIWGIIWETAEWLYHVGEAPGEYKCVVTATDVLATSGLSPKVCQGWTWSIAQESSGRPSPKRASQQCVCFYNLFDLGLPARTKGWCLGTHGKNSHHCFPSPCPVCRGHLMSPVYLRFRRTADIVEKEPWNLHRSAAALRAWVETWFFSQALVYPEPVSVKPVSY